MPYRNIFKINLSIDFLVYSSHKTSTQSLHAILRSNNIKTGHFHTLLHRTHLNQSGKQLKITNTQQAYTQFISSLQHYKNKNLKKIKIISVIRNPISRLLSSFFQSFHTSEHSGLKKGILKKPKRQTTVMTNDTDILLELYNKQVIADKLPGRKESLDELSDIFNINIIEKLILKNNFYYLNHDLFELFVLDFNKLISNNNLPYLNSCLNINCIRNYKKNISENKLYYDKYQKLKQDVPSATKDIILKRYNAFYFSAFS